MSTEDSLEIYDDDNAISFIINALPVDLQTVFEPDDIQYFLDLMFEMDEELVIDDDELIVKMLKEAKKDGMDCITSETLPLLIEAENAYSKSIGLFE